MDPELAERILGNIGKIIGEDAPIGKTIQDMKDELVRLRERERLFMQYLEDTTDGMECLPTCDSYGHDELCPVCNPQEAFRKLRAEIKMLGDMLAEQAIVHGQEYTKVTDENERLRKAIEWAISEDNPYLAEGSFTDELRRRAGIKEK